MRKKIKGYIKEYEKNNKKRFYLEELEKYLINNYRGINKYQENGGYSCFYRVIKELEKEGMIKEIKSSMYNGMFPPLKAKWQIIFRDKVNSWDKSKMFKMADLLDFSCYERHPEYQTDLEWEYINNIYEFLINKENREWLSCEERSLELFYYEKFLTDKGKGNRQNSILSRLGLSYDDLKMKKYGEMFIYWNRGVKNIKKAIILENHSTFFSYKRACEKKVEIFGESPDILIFGQGKKIIKSIRFIEELADINNIKIQYFGDIDPEGFMIYRSLKEKNSFLNINLQVDAYEHLLNIVDRDYPCVNQRKNIKDLNFILEELREKGKIYLEEKIKNLWVADLRIPQELITYEYITMTQ